MKMKAPITLVDELSDDEISATAVLDLDSGEIRDVQYEDYDVQVHGIPALRKDYEFTSGTLSRQGKDVEFSVKVHRTTGEYSVTPDELLEIKKRAAALFAAP